MSYQRPKWVSYTMPSWERPNILKDPPKSIHTKKKERVEMGDVTFMIRNDDSRINEGISYLARGVNPMVDISYSNYGGNGAKLNSMPNIAATNPYKVIKDGAFRPPIMTQEDLLPLSRMRRPETSATTNPGISTIGGFVTPNLQNKVDLTSISNAIDVKKINYLSIRPSATFNISLPINVDVFGERAIQKNKLQFNHYSNPSTNLFDIPDYLKNISDKSIISDSINNNKLQFNHYSNPSTNLIDIPDYLKNTSDPSIISDAINNDNLKVQNITSTPNLKIYIQNGNDITEVQGSVKDKMNIAVQSRLGKPITIHREDGTPIRIKDYMSKVVQSNISDSKFINMEGTSTPIKTKNYISKSVQSNNSLNGGDAIILRINNNEDNIQLSRNVPLYTANSSITPIFSKQHENNGTIELNNKLQTSATTNINDRSMTVSNNSLEYDYETQSMSKIRGMGYIGGIIDTANGISRKSSDVNLPNLSNVNKMTLAY